MNRICIRPLKIDKKYSVNTFFIDEKPLYEYLESGYRNFNRREPERPLVPMKNLEITWTANYDFEGDADFMRFLLKLPHVNLPILSCPEDFDFSCIVIVAEVIKHKTTVMWRRIGIIKQSNLSFEKEKNHGILFLEAYTDDDWLKYGDNIALETIDSLKWREWITLNWREELYRRRINYTFPEFQKDENIEWFFDCNWVFDENEYNSVVQSCYR